MKNNGIHLKDVAMLFVFLGGVVLIGTPIWMMVSAMYLAGMLPVWLGVGNVIISVIDLLTMLLIAILVIDKNKQK